MPDLLHSFGAVLLESLAIPRPSRIPPAAGVTIAASPSGCAEPFCLTAWLLCAGLTHHPKGGRYAGRTIRRALVHWVRGGAYAGPCGG